MFAAPVGQPGNYIQPPMTLLRVHVIPSSSLPATGHAGLPTSGHSRTAHGPVTAGRCLFYQRPRNAEGVTALFGVVDNIDFLINPDIRFWGGYRNRPSHLVPPNKFAATAALS